MVDEVGEDAEGQLQVLIAELQELRDNDRVLEAGSLLVALEQVVDLIHGPMHHRQHDLLVLRRELTPDGGVDFLHPSQVLRVGEGELVLRDVVPGGKERGAAAIHRGEPVRSG